MFHKLNNLLLVVGLWAWLGGTLAADPAPRVVASIVPVQALVAGVMAGVGEPALLLKGTVSPHDYSLRPSDVRQLNEAQVVFWIGDALETFLVKPLANAPKVRNVALMQSPGLTLLPLREGGLWEAHEHQHEPEHKHEHGHADSDHDAHLWLNPVNAMAMVRQISTVLIELDPAHKSLYEQNTAGLLERLHRLDQQLAADLAPLKGQPYIVFHDAYQYFEQRYGLAAAGSITLSPEQKPGAKRIQAIRDRIEQQQVICVFSEPQFEPALVRTLVQGTRTRTGVLDPEGAMLTPGTEAYFQLLNGVAEALRGCLLPKG